MKTRELCLLVIVCSILQLAGIALFARGFFPYKTVLPGFATENGPDDFRELGLVDRLEPAKKVFDKMVFIVIDALRRYVSRSKYTLTIVILCFPVTHQ
jgi:ethanolamine phosphate transferase 2 subunit G